MVRILLAVMLAMAGNLAGADFAGLWTGIMETHGNTVPVRLTLNQDGRQLSGTMTFSDKEQTPVLNAEVHGDALTFAVSDTAQKLAEYRLTWNISGHPRGDRQISLTGKAAGIDAVAKVTLYPTRPDPVSADGGVLLAPVLIHKVDPQYTGDARAAKVQGSVTLRIEIESTGLVSNQPIQVTRSLGYGLDEEAIRCVKQWRFKPAYRDGYAVTAPVSIEVNFRW